MYKKLGLVIPAMLLCLFGLFHLLELFPAPDRFIYDNLLSSARKPAENIIIVGIDERSVNEIGTWPWPRFYVADAIEKLIETDAAAIGVNVLYDTYGQDEESDLRLAAAAEKTDRLVLASMAIFDEEAQAGLIAEDYILPFDELAGLSGTGFINVLPDHDGVMRKALTTIRYGDITVPSLPLEVYHAYCRSMGLDPREDLPLDALGQFSIDYAAKPGGYTELSLWGVINGEYSPALFKDAIVLIGPYAQGLGMDFTTPLERRAHTYAVEINANIIQNMLEGDFKREAPPWAGLAVMAAFGLISAICLYRLRPVPAALASAALIALQLLGSKFAWAQLDIVLHGGMCVIFLFFCYVSYLVLSILATQHEKQHIQGLFGRFVAPEVVREIVSGNVSVELGGSVREVTVLFVDIRGFTAFSEANPPEKVVDMVNRYLSLTSHSIQQYGGTIDKYIGDATMAVFNAPNDLPDHPLEAVRAAWAMQRGAAALREEILRDYGVDLQFGIGINTGTAVIGNMGSDFRMDYTAIGDTVNTAARLEANSQKGQIILSDATYQRVKNHVEATDLGVINVKNKKAGIQIYNLEKVPDLPERAPDPV